MLSLQRIGGFSSLSWATAIVFGIAAIRVAGNAALLESGMLNCLYIMGMPGMAATSPFVVEMWLESLPAQVGQAVLHQPSNVVDLVVGIWISRP